MPSQIIEIDQFEAAFSVPANKREETMRRFSTLMIDADQLRSCGSNGVVSKAQNAFGECFAVKRLRASIVDTPLPDIPVAQVSSGAIASFRHEYESQLMVSRLRGFPRLFGYAMAGNEPLIIMEWIEGVSLADAFVQLGMDNKRLTNELSETPAQPDGDIQQGSITLQPITYQVDPEVVMVLGAQLFGILANLDMLATRPVHRDISPSNVMIRTNRCSLEDQALQKDFDLCIIDFGSTTLIDEQNPTFTATTSILRHATPEYAPPEMLTDTLPNILELRQSPTIDVYAVCSILYQALAGHTPYQISRHPGEVPYLLKVHNAIEPLNASNLVRPTNDSQHQEAFLRACTAIMQGLSIEQSQRPSAADLRDICLLACEEGPLTARETRASSTEEEQTNDHAFASEASSASTLITLDAQGDTISVREASFEHAADPETIVPVNLHEPERLQRDHSHPIHRQPILSRRGFLALAGCAALAIVGGGAFVALSNSASNATDASNAPVSDSANFSSASATATYTGGSLYSARDPETGLWGYLNAQRQWVIAPAFQTVPGLFVGGLALAKDQQSTLFGYINEQGEWALKPLYLKANMFGEGKAFVQPSSAASDSLGGWIDTKGNWTIEPTFFGGGVFKQGLATCRTGSDNSSRWGYVDETGAIVIPEQFMDAGSFSDDGLALAAAHVGQYGWIDRQGAWAIEPQYGKAASFSEGLAGFMDPFSEKWGYLDTTGTEVIAPVFADARLFKAGIAACQDAESKQWGFIDKQGAWAIEPKFEHAGDFAHGLAPAQDAETGKFGYIDDTGYWVIPPQYLDVNLNVME